MSIEDTESVPDGLNSAFYRWFQWFFPDIKEYEKSWQMPLACIAASPEPIPEEEIIIVFDWTNTKLNKLKHILEVLFRKDKNDFEKDTLQLSHKYISEWLFSDAAGRYQLDMKDAFREMGGAFLEVYKSNPEKVTAYEAYHLHDYVNTLTSTRAQNLLLDGLLHGIFIRYGDFAKTWSRFETSMRYYILSEEMALAESAEENGFDRLFRYGQSLSREGDIHKLQSKYRKAHELYYKARILFEKIADGRGTLDDLRGLSVIYEKIGGIYEKQRQYWKALELYRKDRDLSERIARERGMLSDLRSLSVSYYKIARIFEKQTRYNEALEMHRESLKLFERISMERGTLDDLWDLSVSYYTIGRIHEKRCRFEEALQMFRKSMELKNKIVAERGTLDDLKGLSVNYYKIAGVYKTQGRYTEALLLYRKI